MSLHPTKQESATKNWPSVSFKLLDGHVIKFGPKGASVTITNKQTGRKTEVSLTAGGSR